MFARRIDFVADDEELGLALDDSTRVHVDHFWIRARILGDDRYGV